MNIPVATRRFLSHIGGLVARGIHFLYVQCIEPRAATEDGRRRELILNIILSGSVILVGFLEVILITVKCMEGVAYRGVSFVIFALLIAFFSALIVLSRNGWHTIASYLLLGVYVAAITYSLFMWSILLPPVFLSYVMIIVATSVLIGTRAGFVMTGAIIMAVIAVSHLQGIGTLPAQLYWTDEPFSMSAVIQDSLIILAITTISWLSNREIERSLARAHRSEALLTQERNNLEQTVEERTREVKKMQQDQIMQLTRFAEFGKLSSGMFHDLMNPLGAVIANVSQLEKSGDNLPQVKDYLAKAVAASRRMGDYLGTIRKQLNGPSIENDFSLNKEVREAIDILKFHARAAGVTLKLIEKRDVMLHGNPLKIHQVALNLISNAIDAYRGHPSKRCTVTATIGTYHDQALLRVSDHGCGIPPSIQSKIFDVFFTTKSSSHGSGLGLATVHDIVAEHGGTVAFETVEGKGSTFTVLLPLKPAAVNS